MKRVILLVLVGLLCVATAHADTLVLRRADGTTYEMEGQVKRYDDGQFIIILSSGGEMSFSIEQVQAIKFEGSKNQEVAKPPVRKKPRKKPRKKSTKASGISFGEVQQALGAENNLTDLQKRDIWEKKFKGKHISWVGTVDSVDPATFTEGAYLTVRFGGAGVLHLHCSIKDKAEVIHLKKGQRVKVQGVLESWTQFLDMLSVDPVDKIVVVN